MLAPAVALRPGSRVRAVLVVTAGVVPALLVGCDTSPSGGTYSVTDSAGIAVVTNTAPAWGPGSAGWEVAERPVLTIESDEAGDLVLYQVADVAARPGGGVVVANGGSAEVFVFDEEGRLERRFGGRGEGPGEFRSLGAVLPLPGDSVAGQDAGRGRIAVFDPVGKLAREIDLQAVAEARAASRLFRTPSGDLVAVRVAGIGPGTEPGSYRDTVSSLRLSPTGEVVSTFGPFPGSAVYIGPNLMGYLPFGPTLHAGVMGEEVVVGTAESEELRVYGSSGELQRILRWPAEERALTQERIDVFVEHALETVPEPARPRVRPVLESFPYPPTTPPYGALVVSDDGYTWVGEDLGPEMMAPEARPPVRRWKVFDREGGWLGEVVTPEGFTLHEVSGDRLLGVYRDESGVESVRLYALRR